MKTFPLFCLFLACLVCVNARVIKRQKKVRRICQKSCQRPISVVEMPLSFPIEPCSCCNSQKVLIDEPRCGCKYVEILPELPTGMVKLPKSCDPVLPVPMMPFIDFLDPCPCQSVLPWDAPYLDPCACRNRPIVDYISPELPCPKIRNPCTEPRAFFVEPPNCQSQVIQIGYQNDCGCKRPMCPKCLSDNRIEVLYGLPDCCQKLPVASPVELPFLGQLPDLRPMCPKCASDNTIKVLYGLPDCGQKLPVASPVELPLLSQLPDLPVLSYGCPPIPPPEIGCGKYLRQVTLQPPFL